MLALGDDPVTDLAVVVVESRVVAHPVGPVNAQTTI
jgi:hypothetical protein